MKTLISVLPLRWWVLACCLLGMGVAAASPLVQPRSMQLVCSAAGGGQKLVHTSDGSPVHSAHDGMDCALCLLESAPPVPVSSQPPAPAALAGVSFPVSPVHACVPTAAPPPARAPPVFS